jgi:hypothetical protein
MDVGLKSRTRATATCRPNLALSDFPLFGYIKRKLFGYNHENRQDLLNAIGEFLTGANQEMLRTVFEPWVNHDELKSWARHAIFQLADHAGFQGATPEEAITILVRCWVAISPEKVGKTFQIQ